MNVDEKLIEWQAGARLIGLLEAEREKVKLLELNLADARAERDRLLIDYDEPSGPHG
jgi:hypothetical protein